MTERTYTVAEIDVLRQACDSRWLYGTTVFKRFQSPRVFREEERVHCVEELVRTYMLAGITAADIIAEDERMARAVDELMARAEDERQAKP